MEARACSFLQKIHPPADPFPRSSGPKVRAPRTGGCQRAGAKRPPVWVAFFVSYSLFSEYQIGVENLPNFFSDFGWEVICFVGL
jgi:hypothetical protein